MRNRSIDILIIALTIHIFSVQSKLLYHLNPEAVTKIAFSFTNFSEQNILAMVFALAYSLGTVRVLSITRKKTLIAIYAVMDCFGALFYYFPNVPRQFIAVYFAGYTALLIISTIYLDKPEYLSDRILEMKQKGISQKDIALKLKISETAVSRIIKRVQDEKG
jgi:hypothetical protein